MSGERAGRMLNDPTYVPDRRVRDPEDRIAEQDEGRRLDIESDTRGTPAEHRYERFAYGEGS